MGRKSYNRTYEEMLKLARVRALKYYNLNRDAINKKKQQDYQKLKNDSIKQNKS
jgi:hypothetical protein